MTGGARGGRVLGGRYELRRLLASGAMGRVWHAHDTRLGREVAVKVLRGQATGDAAFLHRFRTEARHAANLADPNIAAVHDYGEGSAGDGGEYVAYLVMELVDGEPLSELLRRNAGGLDVQRTLSIVRQTASGLAAAHRAGVVHRDVKPANIVLTRSGRVKLTDFGIAWSAADPRLTDTGTVMGTPHYLAPERMAGEPATAASDVYSLGVVAYECLAGRRPFEGDNSVATALRHVSQTPAPLPPDIPDDVRELVGRVMARDAKARPCDGAALRDAIDALGGPGTTSNDEAPTVVLPAGSRRGRPSRLLVGAAAVAALVLLFLVVAGVRAGRSVGPPAAATRSAAWPSSAATSSATAAAPGHLAPDDLIGRPVDQVRARADATAPVATPSEDPAATSSPVAAPSSAPATPAPSSGPGHKVGAAHGRGHGRHR